MSIHGPILPHPIVKDDKSQRDQMQGGHKCKGDTIFCPSLVGSALKDDTVENRQGQGIMSPKVNLEGEPASRFPLPTGTGKTRSPCLPFSGGA